MNKCLYCNAPIHGSEMDALPRVDDDEEWRCLSLSHGRLCEWVLTRAHRNPLPWYVVVVQDSRLSTVQLCSPSRSVVGALQIGATVQERDPALSRLPSLVIAVDDGLAQTIAFAAMGSVASVKSSMSISVRTKRFAGLYVMQSYEDKTNNITSHTIQ